MEIESNLSNENEEEVPEEDESKGEQNEISEILALQDNFNTSQTRGNGFHVRTISLVPVDISDARRLDRFVRNDLLKPLKRFTGMVRPAKYLPSKLARSMPRKQKALVTREFPTIQHGILIALEAVLNAHTNILNLKNVPEELKSDLVKITQEIETASKLGFDVLAVSRDMQKDIVLAKFGAEKVVEGEVPIISNSDIKNTVQNNKLHRQLGTGRPGERHYQKGPSRGRGGYRGSGAPKRGRFYPGSTKSNIHKFGNKPKSQGA
eukprot:TRINITY_DN6107_c0_g1_i2.p1 TRINITY_DN6107_c0_g1~~TRINITY_DN6107_c0_g1_i2.p1  ORF type:complete len:264 (-),score=-15.05 TRINITY_DN6107_c0_g1_i2:68-859(-)